MIIPVLSTLVILSMGMGFFTAWKAGRYYRHGEYDRATYWLVWTSLMWIHVAVYFLLMHTISAPRLW